MVSFENFVKPMPPKVLFIYRCSKNWQKKSVYNHLFTVIGWKFKFQVQDSFLVYIFLEIWIFEKHIALSAKKPLLRAYCPNIYTVP